MSRERIKFWGVPGTGKTTRLIGIVNDEIDKNDVRPEEIIYTSFTRAACTEAVHRVLTSEAGTVFKKDNFPWFRTEHAICFKLLGLKKEIVFTDKKMQEFSDRYPAYKFTATHGYSFQERHYETMLQSLGDYYEFFISWMDNNMMPFPAAIKQFIGMMKDLPSEFSVAGAQTYMERREEFKRANSLWDFSDMIYTCAKRQICPEVKVIVADECQDMSPLLWNLIEFWASQCERVYVGGDKFQAIFGFAGASPELFENFDADLQILPHSYRLSPQVKDYAGKILSLAGLQLPEFSVADKVGEIKNQQLNSIDWLNIGPAFLLARTRWQLRELSDRLKIMGVPFSMERLGEGPLESSKGEAFCTLIKLQSHERVNADELRSLAKHTRQPWLVKGAKTRIKDLAQADYTLQQVQHFFSQNFLDSLKEDFVDILCQDIDESDKSYLHRVYKKCGVHAFLKKPDLILTTMHGSKGRQKETVIISPEMGRRVYDSFLTDKKSEVFVAYVAATRSMQRIIMLPRETPESFPYPRLNGAGT